MKELYISPELEILCFLPNQSIARENWGGWAVERDAGTHPDLSTGEGNDYTDNEGIGDSDDPLRP